VLVCRLGFVRFHRPAQGQGCNILNVPSYG
jgi:hypothetical protein